MPVQVTSIKWIITLFILISIIIPISSSSAQIDSTRAHADTAIIHRGTIALQFQLGNPFSNREETPLIFSGKYYLSTKTALRLSLEIDISGTQDNIASEYYEPGDTAIQKYSVGFDNEDYKLRFDYLRIKTISSKIKYSWGIGPVIHYSFDLTNRKHYYRNIDESLGLGIAGTLGAEWFPTDRIAFTAEYSLLLEYRERWYERKDESIGGYYRRSLIKEYSVGLKLQDAVFGITIYF